MFQRKLSTTETLLKLAQQTGKKVTDFVQETKLISVEVASNFSIAVKNNSAVQSMTNYFNQSRVYKSLTSHSDLSSTKVKAEKSQREKEDEMYDCMERGELFKSLN